MFLSQKAFGEGTKGSTGSFKSNVIKSLQAFNVYLSGIASKRRFFNADSWRQDIYHGKCSV